MSGNGYNIDNFGMPMNHGGLEKDLTGFDSKIVNDEENKKRMQLRKSFLTLTNFLDRNEAVAYASTMHKCMKAGMWDEVEELVMRCMAMTSVEGKRAEQLVDILTQIQTMKRENDKVDKRASAVRPQGQAV